MPTSDRPAARLRVVAAQFFSPISVLLLLAAGLSILTGETVDGSIILGVLIASTALGAWQEHRAQSAVAALLALVRTKVTVVRDGEPKEVPIEEIVPGDIARVFPGATIPGDGRVLEANDLFVDQSALTGESFPSEKTIGEVPAELPIAERRNAVYLGSHVISGSGTILVARTGTDTEFGSIARRLMLRPPETGFERGIRGFGYLLLEITSALAVCIFAINTALGRPVLESLLFTLALSVGLTPQLLPAIVSVTLSRGAVHMARARVIVRRLACIEDLGGMQVLCTDKTGTITEGTVVVHDAEGVEGRPLPRVRLLAQLNAIFESGFPNPIDLALRAEAPAETAGYVKSGEIPYDFSRKRLSVAITDEGGRRMLVTKGALTSVLDVCARVERDDGSVAAIADWLPKIEARFGELSESGFRCLGVAYRMLDHDTPIQREIERDLVFVGIVTLSDPIKPGAAAALASLHQLGVTTRLITGDNRLVARRLAREASLDASTVVTGADLTRLSDAALSTVAARGAVFAEMEPHQKERVILALRKSGVTVGYLGDGINDAAALHAADVGISVDTASDVTRQAADIVLLDKDLAVLERGVREGRRAFANTLKYVFITTSANFGNMFSMAGASLMLPFLPLLPKQILLTNVLTDIPAMGIATDRLDPELVATPRRWDARSIRRFMLVFGLVSSVFDFGTFALLLQLHAPESVFRTGWFMESVWSELLILLVIRTRRAFFRSRVGAVLGWSSAAVAAVTLALPYTPAGPPLGLVPIPAALAAVLVGVVLTYALASELARRLFFRATLADSPT